MKKVMMAVCFMTISVLWAADNAPQQNKEQITKEAVRANKKAIVAQNMSLAPEQEQTFWSMYDEYQIGINKLNADREAVLTKFSINYNSLSDDLASELLDKVIALEKRRLDLKRELIDKFGKKFPPKVVARYYQIENKIDAAMLAQVAGQVPLAK